MNNNDFQLFMILRESDYPHCDLDENTLKKNNKFEYAH